MKILTTLTLAALLMFGCSNDKATGPTEDPMDYNVIGNDEPQNLDMAMQELSALPVTVPNPVEENDPALTSDMEYNAALVAIDRLNLDEEGRVHFRRILHHLRERMHELRRCMEDNPDPRVRRLAHGAFHAIQHGIRALENDHPRIALRSFRVANRILNFAIRVCNDDEGDRRPQRPERPVRPIRP